MNALAGLNSLLDDFYSSYADVDTVGRWLASHAFEEALPDHAEAAALDGHLARDAKPSGKNKDGGRLHKGRILSKVCSKRRFTY